MAFVGGMSTAQWERKGFPSTCSTTRKPRVSIVMSERTTFSNKVEMSGKVPGSASRLQEFMKEDPGALIIACWSEKFVSKISNGVYRTTIPPVKFLNFSMRAHADVRVTYDESAKTLRLESVASSVDVPNMGLDAKTFRLDLTGYLRGIERGQQTWFDGKADLQVSLELPPFARLMPKPVVSAAGAQLTTTVLSLMRRNLSISYPRQYKKWLRSREQQPLPSEKAKVTQNQQRESNNKIGSD